VLLRLINVVTHVIKVINRAPEITYTQRELEGQSKISLNISGSGGAPRVLVTHLVHAIHWPTIDLPKNWSLHTTSTLPPRMHQKLTKHEKFCKQNNQLPTKSHDELERTTLICSMGSSKMVEGWPQVLDSNWWLLKPIPPLNNWWVDLPIWRNSQSQTDFLREACMVGS
jgi:hypothetical protein